MKHRRPSNPVVFEAWSQTFRRLADDEPNKLLALRQHQFARRTERFAKKLRGEDSK